MGFGNAGSGRRQLKSGDIFPIRTSANDDVDVIFRKTERQRSSLLPVINVYIGGAGPDGCCLIFYVDVAQGIHRGITRETTGIFFCRRMRVRRKAAVPWGSVDLRVVGERHRDSI